MPYAAHLLVVCHGLWGTRNHVAYICKAAAQYGGDMKTSSRSRARSNSKAAPASPEETEDVRLVVLPAALNEWTSSYDGIDLGGERVVQEIDQEIERIRLDGGEVKRFSIVGYSWGGLVARYVLGLLESRTPSFFANVRPVNFATFASPAIGIPRYDSFWSVVIRYLGARLLSRSGSQLYENDRFLPSSLLEGNNQSTKPAGFLSRFSFAREEAAPLLEVMADPRYSFYKALAAFERVEIYCNAVNDRTVPYPTGAIEAHDPFSLARALAAKAAAHRGDDPDADINIADGGLEITLEADGVPIIASYQPITPPLPPSPAELALRPKKPFKIQLPLLLRPSTYPFSRPVSLFLIIFIPITLPMFLVVTITRFLLQGRSSRARIRTLRAGMGGGREGMLERVGVKLRTAMEEVAENVQPDNPDHSYSDLALDGASAELMHDSKVDERSPVIRHPAVAAFTNYGGTETPPLARPVSPGNATDELATGSDKKPYPTDPVLSRAQVEMIRNLNAIPQLRKHLAYFPTSRNSHGMIVARDLNFAPHKEGIKVVDSWAKEFRL